MNDLQVKNSRLSAMITALIKHLEQHMTQHPESYSDNDQRWLDAAKAVYVECKE